MENFEQAFPGLMVAGPGSRARAGELCGRFGRRVLVILGASSLDRAGFLEGILASLEAERLEPRLLRHAGEPSARDADAAAREARDWGADCILGLGGGSVLDLAKAAAALAATEGRAEDYLEGIGALKLSGPFLPWIAAPTTAGTGSECTSNSVLKGRGPEGSPYKRSLRDPGLLPRAAILDPDFQIDCPAAVALPRAFDALAQLIESATSQRATPLTDALVFRGLELIAPGIGKLADEGARLDDGDRLGLALAASLSGLGLSGAGLGLVHGMAGPLGALADLPHGLACALLLRPCFEASLAWLEREAAHEDPLRSERARQGLDRCARVGRALGAGNSPRAFLELLRTWSSAAGFPSLSASLGGKTTLKTLVDSASCRDSFARPGKAEIEDILSTY